jgi:3-dehydro-L-gulonate 2-dehydrogenase
MNSAVFLFYNKSTMPDKVSPPDYNEVYISLVEMETKFYEVLVKAEVSQEKAKACAKVFAENSLEGVYTHGVNRFPRFIQYIKEKHVLMDKEPLLLNKFGAVEQWDGQSGAGILNALFCTERAMDIAKENGIGCVAISQTNHWMRGGTYGWKAAKQGFAFICWTNTIANMPAWGAKDSRLGNNPLIFAIPYEDEAIVLDMAMSQFSFGKMELMEMQGDKLPVAGGFDKEGNLSKDPGAILKTNRSLPIGYWKGSGLALLLDILATVLSGGLSTYEISSQATEKNVSQVFVAIDLSKLNNASTIKQALQQIIEDYKGSEPIEKSGGVRYPGESVVKTRKENIEKGIPVSRKVWEEILRL